MTKSNFGKGLLWGTIIGTITVLSTTTKTGKQRQQGIRDYIDGLSNATTQVTTSVAKLGQTATNLRSQIIETAIPTINAIQKDIADYQFQIEPRMAAVNEQTEKIQNKMDQLNKATE